MDTEKQNGADQSAASTPISQKDIKHNNTTTQEVQYRITHGNHIRQSVWDDVRSYTGAELCQIMTDHQEGEKDGLCFTPAVFRGTQRKKMEADQIDLLTLDCDTGETLEEIKTALKNEQLGGIIYSTHSHMKDAESPCPKFRVIIPLEKPWRADNFDSQAQANDAWAKAIFEIADRLSLEHDQSCKDTSRVYYFPRHSKGAEYITDVVQGHPCKIDWSCYKETKTAYINNAANDLSPYLQKSLDNELSILRSAREGERNQQLNRSAFALAQLIAQGLPQTRIIDELTPVALGIGLDKEEVNNTITSAIAAGTQQERQRPQDKPKQVKPIQDFDGYFEPIVPFDQYSTPVISTGLLPSEIGNYAKNISDIICVPEALPVMTALGVISSALSKKFIISPKKDWCEPINIYTAVALPPGSSKSLVTKKMTAPLEEWEENEARRVRPIREEKLAELKTLQLKIKKTESIIKDKKTKPEEMQLAEQEYKELSQAVIDAERDVPATPKLYANNVTPEALEQYLYEQNERFAIISDEGGVLETLSGLYSKGNANVDIILKGIDGGSIRIKRQNREYAIKPHLSLVLIVQPQILSSMADKKSFRGNGALERFLYALPVPNIGFRTITDETLDTFFEDQYCNCIYNLLCMEIPEEPHVITLSSPSKKLWTDFRKEIEKEMRPDGALYICCGWGAKIAGYALRIAGILHVAKHANTSHLIIEEETMKDALTLAHLLCEHTVATYGLMALDQETQDAKELYEWVRAQGVDMLKKSDIVNGLRNRHMGKKERLSKALDMLVERNILSDLHKDYRTKKPTECYFVNPQIY